MLINLCSSNIGVGDWLMPKQGRACFEKEVTCELSLGRAKRLSVGRLFNRFLNADRGHDLDTSGLNESHRSADKNITDV
jgi:hypothetical protein